MAETVGMTAIIRDLVRENRNLQQQIDRLTLPYQEWWDKWHKPEDGGG